MASAATAFSLAQRHVRGHVVVAVRGEIDMATAPALRSAVAGEVANGSREVILDLREVSFIDSSGLHVLRQLRDLRRAGVTCRMLDGSPPVLRLLETTGLSDVLPRADAIDCDTLYEHFCPHCSSRTAQNGSQKHPQTAIRCHRCRLLIGVGRCRGAPDDSLTSGSGSAAGVMANAARRADAAPGDPHTIHGELAAVAAAQRVALERLRMTDYDAAQRRGLVRTELAEVLATFTSWKNARATAAAALQRDGAPVGSGLGAGGDVVAGRMEHEHLG